MSNLAQRRSTGASSQQPQRILVIGGNGYIGSRVAEELVRRKRDGTPLAIASMSRRGTPPQAATSTGWAGEVDWLKGDALAGGESVNRAMKDATAVISCVGGFGSVATMQRVNGEANAKAMALAHAAQVRRFVYVSAHHFPLPQFLKQGYFSGKFQAEKALTDTFGAQGVQIRPGFVYGTRQVGSVGVPLGLIGWPLQQLTSMSLVRSLTRLPLVGPLLELPLTPPSSVEAVARAVVDAALAPQQPKQTIIDVDDLQKYE